jgi:hypothetical protein
MGDWKQHADGEKVTPAEQHEWVQEKLFVTITDRNLASVGWGANEIFRQCKVTATGYKYYWNGASWVAFPSMGGAGAPTTATYVTINSEVGALPNSVQHELLTNAGGHLHEPLYHHLSHENAGGLDKINVLNLSGKLADEQNAGWIKTKSVDAPVAGDDLKFLQYIHGASKFQLTTLPAGGDMLKADYALDAVRVKLAVDSDTLDGSHAASFAGIVHKNRHISGGADSFLTFGAPDLLDGIARVTVRKNTGANVGSRRRLNFIEGTGISFTITDVGGSEEVTVRVDATGAGLGGTWSTGICSGRSPIVTPHSLGGVPTLVLASINAAQPYPSPCWTADATNITFRHAVTAGCTITFAARL